jgi:hypothetical protein
VRGAGEALVAATAGAAPRHHRALSGPHQVVHGAVRFDAYLGAGRHRYLQCVAIAAVAQRTLSVAASAGFEVRLAPEALQIAQRVVAHEHDVAAASPVAAVGAALGDVCLAPEAKAPVAAAAGGYVDSSAVLHG